MRLTLVGLLLFASTALGQASVTFSATGDVIQNNQIVVSRANCSADRVVSWTRTGLLCDTLFLWLSNDTSCSREPAAADLPLADISASDTGRTSGSLTFSARLALARSNLSCDSADETKTWRLCASTKQRDAFGACQTSFSSVGGTPNIDFIFDPVPPDAPVAPGVTGLDAALSVSVTVPTDAVLMEVQVFSIAAGEDGGVGAGELIDSKEQASSNTVFRMDRGLENGVEYAVQAIAIDRAGNRSDPSPRANGTPVASRGFYEGYLGAGGAETGGCTAAGGGITGCAMLASLGIWLSSRRKRS